MAASSKPTRPDSYPARGTRRLARAHDAVRLDLHAAGTPDRVAADLDALASAKDRLVQQAAAVDELLCEARRLATPMHDGHGPMAEAMQAPFHQRAEELQGVVRALTDYRDGLTMVLSAIQQTMESYGRSGLPARRRLGASGGADG